MKKIKNASIGLLLLLPIGCQSIDPVSSTTEGAGVRLELLFEKDGCKVYRFQDGGKTVY